MIHVRCHKCNKKYAVPAEAKGKRIRCRRCQQIIVVSEDVTDWLNAMSYAASQWQDSDDKTDAAAKEPPAEPGPSDANPNSSDPIGAALPTADATQGPVGKSQQPQAPSASEPSQDALPGEPAAKSGGLDISTDAAGLDAETDSATKPGTPSTSVRMESDLRQRPGEPPDRRLATKSVMRLLVWHALLATLLAGAFLLVLGLWLGGVIRSPMNRYMIAGLAGLATVTALAAHLWASWRIARICRDLDRRR